MFEAPGARSWGFTGARPWAAKWTNSLYIAKDFNLWGPPLGSRGRASLGRQMDEFLVVCNDLPLWGPPLGHRGRARLGCHVDECLVFSPRFKLLGPALGASRAPAAAREHIGHECFQLLGPALGASRSRVC